MEGTRQLKTQAWRTRARGRPRRPGTGIQETPVQVAGSRYYSPGLGRWTSRDPIGERGGINLHAFVRNCSADHIDALGREGRKCCLKEPLKLCWQSKDLWTGNVIIDQTVRFEHDPNPPKCCDSSCCGYAQAVRGQYRRFYLGQWQDDPKTLDSGEMLDPNEFRDDNYSRNNDAGWYHRSIDGTEEYYNGNDKTGVNDNTTSHLGNLAARLEFMAYVWDKCRGLVDLTSTIYYSVEVVPWSYPPSFSGPPKRYKITVKGIPKCSGPPKWK
jgi:RHS repeat-associated protein